MKRRYICVDGTIKQHAQPVESTCRERHANADTRLRLPASSRRRSALPSQPEQDDGSAAAEQAATRRHASRNRTQPAQDGADHAYQQYARHEQRTTRHADPEAFLPQSPWDPRLRHPWVRAYRRVHGRHGYPRNIYR